MLVTLRPVRPEDHAFLYTVYDSSREQELAQVPWSDAQREAFLRMQLAAQTDDYVRRFPNARHSIILVDDVPVGRIYVAETDDAIKVLDLIVLPAYRRKGAASFLLNDLRTAAGSTHKSILIWVETLSPALNFFERAGFSRLQEDGFNTLMKWFPAE